MNEKTKAALIAYNRLATGRDDHTFGETMPQVGYVKLPHSTPYGDLELTLCGTYADGSRYNPELKITTTVDVRGELTINRVQYQINITLEHAFGKWHDKAGNHYVRPYMTDSASKRFREIEDAIRAWLDSDESLPQRKQADSLCLLRQAERADREAARLSRHADAWGLAATNLRLAEATTETPAVR